LCEDYARERLGWVSTGDIRSYLTGLLDLCEGHFAILNSCEAEGEGEAVFLSGLHERKALWASPNEEEGASLGRPCESPETSG